MHPPFLWAGLVRMMSGKPQTLAPMGPIGNYAEYSKRIAAEVAESTAQLKEFNDSLLLYYKQLADTWFDAQKKVNAKVPQVPQDAEQFKAYKGVWTAILDNDFTELFGSKRFGKNYGKLVAQEMELANHWNNITGMLLKSANLPDKKEIDGVCRQIHDLKKRISALESQLLFKRESKTDDAKTSRIAAGPKGRGMADGAKAAEAAPGRQSKADVAEASKAEPKLRVRSDDAGKR